MAKVTSKDIQGILKPQIMKAFSQTALMAAAKALGKQMVDEIHLNMVEGYDTRSRRFGGYSSSYQKQKRKLLSGRMKGRGGKGASKTLRKYRANKTPNAAKKVSDKLRLTGELWEDIAYKKATAKIQGDTILTEVTVYVKPRSQKKAEGLMSTTGRNRYSSYSKKAWLFLGITSGARKQKQQSRLVKAFLKELSVYGVGIFK